MNQCSTAETISACLHFFVDKKNTSGIMQVDQSAEWTAPV